MSKNYRDQYAYSGDSIALEQRVYVKQETTRGTLIAPQNTDFIFHIGGSSEFSQPFESSPHKSGRHNNNVIYGKKEHSWAYQTFFNIDPLAAAGDAEVDNGIQALFRSLFGTETIVSNTSVTYNVGVPDFTLTIFEVGGKWCKQQRGCFVQGGNLQFPGDGRATIDWSGMGKDELWVGIGKSTEDNDGGNTVEVQLGEGKRFPVGALVMLVEADGTTRSSDTAAGTARVVTAVNGDIITLSGAALADADGSGGSAPLYLSYYEPAAPVAIDAPQTGLEGSITIDSFTVQKCMRSFAVNMQNNHEAVDYCFGHDSLDTPFFIPGGRFQADVTFESNLNDEVFDLIRRTEEFEAEDLTIVLGPASGRHLTLTLPKVKLKRPSVSIPESGSIPISFEGLALQTAFDAGDEVTIQYL